jgi:hypothetical protein
VKQEKHSYYDPEHTELCEKALVEVWQNLRDYEDSLVFLGGLVPRFFAILRPMNRNPPPWMWTWASR